MVGDSIRGVAGDGIEGVKIRAVVVVRWRCKVEAGPLGGEFLLDFVWSC